MLISESPMLERASCKSARSFSPVEILERTAFPFQDPAPRARWHTPPSAAVPPTVTRSHADCLPPNTRNRSLRVHLPSGSLQNIVLFFGLRLPDPPNQMTLATYSARTPSGGRGPSSSSASAIAASCFAFHCLRSLDPLLALSHAVRTKYACDYVATCHMLGWWDSWWLAHAFLVDTTVHYH